jgi:transposase
MVLKHQDEHGWQHGAIRSIAAEIGCSGGAPRNGVRQAERATDERARIQASERGNREFQQANEILRKASFAQGSSTVGSGHDRLHRGASSDLRGRLSRAQDEADLQGLADRPVNILCPCVAADRFVAAAGPGHARREADGRHPPRVRSQLRRLWGLEGVATVRPPGDRDRLPSSR